MSLIWIAITIVSIIFEILTIDLVGVWFAVGGLSALLALMLGLPQSIQIILFIAVSVICIIFTRPIAKKYMKTNTVRTNYDRIIGKHGIVERTISPNQKGEVRVMSTSWSAIEVNNGSIEIGQTCEILAIEGAHVIVKKI